MPQVDPWEKAADCERALRITVDPIRRETLSNIREFWIALAQESRFFERGGLGRTDRNDRPSSCQARPRHPRLDRIEGQICRLAQVAANERSSRVATARRAQQRHHSAKLTSAVHLDRRPVYPAAESP